MEYEMEKQDKDDHEKMVAETKKQAFEARQKRLEEGSRNWHEKHFHLKINLFYLW